MDIEIEDIETDLGVIGVTRIHGVWREWTENLPLQLRTAIAGLPYPRGPMEGYTLTMKGEAESGTLLWLRGDKRAGFVWGGDAVWVDAEDVPDAVRRWAKL